MVEHGNQYEWLLLGFLAFVLVTAVLGTLGAWTHHHVDRHRLIVASKKRRREYLEAKAKAASQEEMMV